MQNQAAGVIQRFIMYLSCFRML